MNDPEKRLNRGFSMPAVGLGTWQMGGREIRNRADNGASSVQALIAGINMGYTHIDTAEMYAEGFTEEIVGRAVAGFDRTRLFLTTKVWKTHLKYDDVLRAAEGSLKRLGTDYIDLYLIHQVNDAVPLEETIRAMNRLHAEGIVRSIGVSNFSVKRLERAQACSDAPIVANQVHYNLKVREAVVSGMLDYCRKNDVMLIAWRPFQKGGMLGDQMPKLLLDLAAKYGKSPSEIAIAWLLMQKNVVTISMSHNPLHMRRNLSAAKWEMDRKDFELLTECYPGQQAVSDAVPLS